MASLFDQPSNTCFCYGSDYHARYRDYTYPRIVRLREKLSRTPSSEIHVIAHYRALDDTKNDHKLCTSPFQSHDQYGVWKRDREKTEGYERGKKMSSIDTTSSPFTVRDETDASRREAATPPLPFRTSLRPPTYSLACSPLYSMARRARIAMGI